MPVRSLTLSSPVASSTNRRRRVGSAMALRARTAVWTDNRTGAPTGSRRRYDIKISLYVTSSLDFRRSPSRRRDLWGLARMEVMLAISIVMGEPGHELGQKTYETAANKWSEI